MSTWYKGDAVEWLNTKRANSVLRSLYTRTIVCEAASPGRAYRRPRLRSTRRCYRRLKISVFAVLTALYTDEYEVALPIYWRLPEGLLFRRYYNVDNF